MTWLITANTNSCRIFQYDKKSKSLTLVKELIHNESRLKGIDLESDKPGHYLTTSSAHGTFQPHKEPKEIEVDHFAQNIAKELDQGRRTNQYEKLILAIPPHMHGLLNQHLESHVKNCINLNINKDYTHLTEKEILEAMKKNEAL